MRLQDMNYVELRNLRAIALDYIKVEEDSERKGTRRYNRPQKLEELSLVLLKRIDAVLIERFTALVNQKPDGNAVFGEDLNAVNPDGNCVFGEF